MAPPSLTRRSPHLSSHGIDADNLLPLRAFSLCLSSMSPSRARSLSLLSLSLSFSRWLPPFLSVVGSLLRYLAFSVLLPHDIARFVYRKKGGKTHLEDGRRPPVTDLSLSRMTHSFPTNHRELLGDTAAHRVTIHRVVNCDTKTRATAMTTRGDDDDGRRLRRQPQSMRRNTTRRTMTRARDSECRLTRVVRTHAR